MPDGAQLVLASVLLSDGPWTKFAADGKLAAQTDVARITVVAGQADVTISRVRSSGGLIVAAVVRADAPVSLVVTDLGRSAGINLRTGAAATDAVSAAAASLPAPLKSIGTSTSRRTSR